MTKKEIIDYIMETPQNTNTAILSQMLDEVAGEGGGSMEPLIVHYEDCTYEYDYKWQLDTSMRTIIDAFKSGRLVVILGSYEESEDGGLVKEYSIQNNTNAVIEFGKQGEAYIWLDRETLDDKPHPYD